VIEMEEIYEIIDKNGILDSGTKDEMIELFEDIISGDVEREWEGELQLVKVINFSFRNFKKSFKRFQFQ
jgi:hypothetical protein